MNKTSSYFFLFEFGVQSVKNELKHTECMAKTKGKMYWFF